MLGKDPGHDRQRAGLVINTQLDLVARQGGLGPQDRQVGVTGLTRRLAAVDPVRRRGDDVGQDRRGRRGATGALSVEHEAPGRLRLDEDGVEGAVDAGQRVVGRHEGRVDTHGDAAGVVVVAPLGDGQQLDLAA